MNVKSNTPEVGRLAPPGSERDAIHVAIAPIVAGASLRPGDRVGLNGNGEAVSTGSGHLGIVDPFLDRKIAVGELFWLFMLPNSITSLRHDWKHPKFPKVVTGIDDTQKARSIEWLTDWAQTENMTYAQLMEGLAGYTKNGELYCIGYDLNYSRFDEGAELWKHYGIVVGKQFEHTEVPFQCAC